MGLHSRTGQTHFHSFCRDGVLQNPFGCGRNRRGDALIKKNVFHFIHTINKGICHQYYCGYSLDRVFCIHWIAFFVSGKISNPSTSLVGFATCSFWAAILEPIIKRKKISAIEIALGVVVLIGLGIILAFDFKHPLGLLLGVISGLTAAWFSIINSKLVHQVNAYTITFYEMLGACLLILFFMPFYVKLPGVDQLNIIPTLSDWFYISIMAWACSVYAFTASINLSKRISVFMIQLALNLVL